MRGKKDFTETAKTFAHDANNLLAVIEGYFDLAMLDTDSPSGSLKEGLPLARRAAADLESLVSDFANIIVMEENRLVAKLEPTDIGALISDIVRREAGPAAKEAGVKLSAPGTGAPVRCDVDRRLVSKIVCNLMMSAMRGTPEGGRVEVTAQDDGSDRVKITVRDSGPIVPPEWRKKIFEKDSLGEISTTKLKKRAGLELVFCKMAVEAHGGRIWAEAEGRKNAFIITIPR